MTSSQTCSPTAPSCPSAWAAPGGSAGVLRLPMSAARLEVHVAVGVAIAVHMIVAVLVAAGLDGDGDQIEAAVADAPFGHQRIGEAAHAAGRAAQDDALDAIVVVEMGV